jgi:hypothetical protein
MPNDYYSPANDIVLTVALMSLLTYPLLTYPISSMNLAEYTSACPELSNSSGAFYIEAPPPLDEASQLAALESFGKRLLAETVQVPQAAVDLLNREFWNLV